MTHIAMLSALLAVTFGMSSGAQDQDEPGPTITIRGTAIASSGEPAGDIPILVSRVVKDGTLALAEGRTAPDGAFHLEIASKHVPAMTDLSGKFPVRISRGLLTVEFGDKHESEWGRVTFEVEQRDIDLKTVKLKPRVERKPEGEGSRLCFAVALLFFGGPVGLLLTRCASPSPSTGARDSRGGAR